MLWKGEHVLTHNRLYLQQRTDREELLSLYEQSMQICSVALWRFGDLPLPQPAPIPEQHPTLEKALKLMIPIASAYERNELVDTNAVKAAQNQGT